MNQNEWNRQTGVNEAARPYSPAFLRGVTMRCL